MSRSVVEQLVVAGGLAVAEDLDGDRVDRHRHARADLAPMPGSRVQAGLVALVGVVVAERVRGVVGRGAGEDVACRRSVALAVLLDALDDLVDLLGDRVARGLRRPCPWRPARAASCARLTYVGDRVQRRLGRVQPALGVLDVALVLLVPRRCSSRRAIACGGLERIVATGG